MTARLSDAALAKRVGKALSKTREQHLLHVIDVWKARNKKAQAEVTETRALVKELVKALEQLRRWAKRVDGFDPTEWTDVDAALSRARKVSDG